MKELCIVCKKKEAFSHHKCWSCLIKTELSESDAKRITMVLTGYHAEEEY